MVVKETVALIVVTTTVLLVVSLPATKAETWVQMVEVASNVVAAAAVVVVAKTAVASMTDMVVVT